MNLAWGIGYFVTVLIHYFEWSNEYHTTVLMNFMCCAVKKYCPDFEG